MMGNKKQINRRLEERKGMFRQVKLHLKQGKYMHALVDFIIGMDWFSHYVGYFKPGDKVRYNWKAKIVLKSLDKIHGTYTIQNYWCDSNVNFEEGSGSSAFWLRKLYPWEK